MRLYHYTCDDGMRGIGEAGVIRPNTHLLLSTTPPIIWLTDLDVPDREALGLTGLYTRCDRTLHRLTVDTDDTDEVQHWPDAARSWNIPRPTRDVLESGRTLPMHWYVTARCIRWPRNPGDRPPPGSGTHPPAPGSRRGHHPHHPGPGTPGPPSQPLGRPTPGQPPPGRPSSTRSGRHHHRRPGRQQARSRPGTGRMTGAGLDPRPSTLDPRPPPGRPDPGLSFGGRTQRPLTVTMPLREARTTHGTDLPVKDAGDHIDTIRDIDCHHEVDRRQTMRQG